MPSMIRPLRISSRIAAFAALAVLMVTATSACAAKDDLKQPSWMKIDAEAKTVTLHIAAGWNGNNGALNFNGYYDGDAKVVIPVGWAVTVDFRNDDASLPHSLLVTKPYTKKEMPESAGREEVAISRAYTRNPREGISGGKTGGFRFKAKEAGNYYFLCGVTGHAQAGMWIHLSLSDAAKEPGIIPEKGSSGRD